mmetsp:Transcript_65680/g.108975  ORF Transcript_65680/g.108975 Transcript_65680/m.108975 type:complete len:690 (-) Transcript_65680:73-2142(-)
MPKQSSSPLHRGQSAPCKGLPSSPSSQKATPGKKTFARPTAVENATDVGKAKENGRGPPDHSFFQQFRRIKFFDFWPFVFSVCFACFWPFLVAWFQPEKIPDPVRESALRASNTIAKAFDDVLSSSTMEGLLNTTSKLKQIVDVQALRMSIEDFGRMSIENATSAMSGFLPETRFGMKELLSTWQVPSMNQVLGKVERVGVRMARNGANVHHPVVMIPGIVTTGLEVWDGEQCLKSYFRQRIWGQITMFQSMLSDPDCWLRHLALNASTGLDPLQRPHMNRSIRVRPAQGFEGADFFLGGYWLWGLMIEALADIGYDLNSMYMASYDWRLSFADLERRDRYFTRLRQQIETLVSMNGRKALVLAHSMGGNLWHYFMQWVTHKVHKNWVNDHIASEVLVSSPVLGLPKAYHSLLTGDNRDFSNMGTITSIANHFFGPAKRRALWRTFSSLALIMPIGGESIWGPAVTGRPLVQLGSRNLTMEEAYDLLAKKDHPVAEDLERISPWLLDGIRQARPAGPDHGAVNADVPERFWANVLVSPLPFAPNLRKYAFYGSGIPTEFSGVLEEHNVENAQDTPYIINRTATEHAGLHLGNGDYSCPVLSLGMMCAKGWLNEKRNPAKIPCTVKEFPDKPTTLLAGRTMRGGPASGDHVDLLGNDELLEDVLKIASGGDVDGRIVSELKLFTERWDDT